QATRSAPVDSRTMHLLFAGLAFVLFLVALIDLITRDETQVKHLPKMVWIIIVILLPFIGSLLWFLVGREWPQRSSLWPAGQASSWDRPTGSSPAPGLSTEEQLARLDREIAEEEARARIRELEAEIERRKSDSG